MDKHKKEEISALVAKEVRELGLDNVFNEDILKKIQEVSEERINKTKMLDEEVDTTMKEVEIVSTEEDVKPISPIQTVDAVSDAVSDAESDAVNYNPVLPEFIDKIEPEKFIVFDQNELSLGGEHLSKRPFILFDDPDSKKSIHDAWVKDGKKKGEVYVARFEKIGELEYDYRNGTTRFVEDIVKSPEEMGQAEISSDNPYAETSKPEVIDNNIDVESEIKGYIEDILKDYFNKKDYETSVSEPVEEAPLNENKLDESFSYRQVVMSNDFEKTETPVDLIESIEGNSDKAQLVSENDSVEIWKLDESEYVISKGYISLNSCHKKVL